MFERRGFESEPSYLFSQNPEYNIYCTVIRYSIPDSFVTIFQIFCKNQWINRSRQFVNICENFLRVKIKSVGPSRYIVKRKIRDP